MPAGNYYSVLSHGLLVPQTTTPADAGVLSVTDDADGTGATATVTASGGGENVVTVFKLNGEVGSPPEILTASRTGDGTLSLSLTPGLYFAALSTDGVFGNLVYFAATDGLDAVATRCRRSVADVIRLLPIPPAENVYEHGIPDPENVVFPCTILSVEGVQEGVEAVLSTRDDVSHPVKVQIADRCDKRELRTKLPTYEKWRQAIVRCFLNQQLPGVPESKWCTIEPYVIVDPNLPQYEYMVSGLVVRAVCREPRGIGA